MSDKITNKKILLAVNIMIGIITLSVVIALVYVGLSDIGVMHAWRLESILGALAVSGLGGLTYFTKKIVDTRSEQERDKAKQTKRSSRYNYKLEKLRLRKQIKEADNANTRRTT